MDDTQNTQQPVNNSAVSQQQITVPAGQNQQPAVKKDEMPVTPISSPAKEAGPAISHGSETLAVPSSPEMVSVPESLHEMGVEAISERPTLTPEDTQAGIVHSPGSAPISTAATTTITLPMTQQQAQQTVKLHKKVKDSLFWLAMLILRQWQIAKRTNKLESSKVSKGSQA